MSSKIISLTQPPSIYSDYLSWWDCRRYFRAGRQLMRRRLHGDDRTLGRWIWDCTPSPRHCTVQQVSKDYIPRHKKKTRRLSISGQWCCHKKNVSFWGCDAVARKSVLALTLTMKKYLKNKISRNCSLQEILQWHKKKIKPVWRIRNVLILIPLLVFWSWSGFRSKLLLCFNGKFLSQQTNFNSNKIFFFFLLRSVW